MARSNKDSRESGFLVVGRFRLPLRLYIDWRFIGGTLAAQLKKLKENGTIESRLFEWAEMLRTMGNEAAHGVGFAVSREDAQDTLEFTEALIEYAFTYRDKFEEFKKRRAKATAQSKEVPADKQKGQGSGQCQINDFAELQEVNGLIPRRLLSPRQASLWWSLEL
jgi:hypothetical protein